VTDPYLRERIENWASDFCATDAMRAFGPPLPEYAPGILSAFLSGAAASAGGLDDLREADVRRGLVEHAARVEMPASVKARVADLCASFLEQLEIEGRLADGRRLATYARAAKGAFEGASGVQKTFRRPATKVGPNEPCPCGSNRKFKKCCQGLLPS
jgi:hypothetical protein